jgi:DNA modification methylase
MSIAHRDDWLTIHQGDCRAVLAGLEAGSVHTVVTSPPYWGLRDYGTATWEGGDAACDHSPDRQPRTERARGGLTGSTAYVAAQEPAYRGTCGKCGATRQDAQLGLEPTPEEYVANMVAVFREVRRVLRDDGTLWLNLGDTFAANRGYQVPDSKHRDVGNSKGMKADAIGLKPKDLVGIPWRVAFALQADGWYLRSDIIWAKPNPMPESVTDRPTKSHEYLFLLAKSERYYFDADAVREDGAGRMDLGKMTNPARLNQGGEWTHTEKSEAGRNIRSVWTIATQPYPGAHFATFPPKLVEPCILAGTSERGVCPECGAPWRRVVERVGAEVKAPRSAYGHGAGRNDGGRSQLVGAATSTTGWRPTCAHGHCVTCDNEPNAERTNVPSVQTDVSPRPPRAADLLDRMREPIEGRTVEDRATVPGVRGVLRSDEATGDVLFPDLLERGDGTDQADHEGLRGQPQGLHPPVPAEAPDGDEDRLRGGAPTGDGGDAGPDAGAVGGRGSHQRHQERQPAGEPAGADEADARSHLQPGSGSDDDMPGVRAPLPSPGTCDQCGGQLTPLDPVPGVVLDVFGGSGTTAMVAQHLGRRAVLIELNPDYIGQQLRRNAAVPLWEVPA